jgi:hypothetical protein
MDSVPFSGAAFSERSAASSRESPVSGAVVESEQAPRTKAPARAAAARVILFRLIS